ncbi:hypothetical protein H1R20_g2962, partial [Candolleomyces eurysporus]
MFLPLIFSPLLLPTPLLLCPTPLLSTHLPISATTFVSPPRIASKIEDGLGDLFPLGKPTIHKMPNETWDNLGLTIAEQVTLLQRHQFYVNGANQLPAEFICLLPFYTIKIFCENYKLKDDIAGYLEEMGWALDDPVGMQSLPTEAWHPKLNKLQRLGII